LSVLDVVEFSGALLASENFYALKLAYGPKIARLTELYVDAPMSENLCRASRALGKSVDTIVVCVLDRPRHRPIIDELRKIGARLKLIQDCDVSGTLATCLPDSGVDLLFGVGGTPEAVIAACAMKCLGLATGQGGGGWFSNASSTSDSTQILRKSPVSRQRPSANR